MAEANPVARTLRPACLIIWSSQKLTVALVSEIPKKISARAYTYRCVKIWETEM